MYTRFEELIGKTFSKVSQETYRGEEAIIFYDSEDDACYGIWHDQDCCESVGIDSIGGDLADLVGSPITMAEEVYEKAEVENPDWGYVESATWSFYKLATVRGYVTIRFYGSSNGFYSEIAEFHTI